MVCIGISLIVLEVLWTSTCVEEDCSQLCRFLCVLRYMERSWIEHELYNPKEQGYWIMATIGTVSVF